MSLVIRCALPGDSALLLSLIRKLAAFERLADEVDATTERIDADLFGAAPKAFCEIAEWNGEPAGFALWFYNFSTFRGRHGLYLEDLYIEPAYRGHGIGRSLLRHLARRCASEGLARLEWWVLDWNDRAIEFYRSLGAVAMDDWTVYRLTGAALERLAED